MAHVDVLDAWDEGPLLRAFRLASLPAYEAGQALKVKHRGSSAFYALATAYGHDRAPELLLRRGHGIADALIESVRAGSTLEFDGPMGPGFPIEHARGHDVLCIAVGAGISAIRSVVETLIDDRAAYGRVTLLYGQDRADHFAYAEACRAWARANVNVVLCARAPDATWRGARGRVQDVITERGLDIDVERGVAYLCGMPEMIAAVRELAGTLGLSPERTYLNY